MQILYFLQTFLITIISHNLPRVKLSCLLRDIKGHISLCKQVQWHVIEKYMNLIYERLHHIVVILEHKFLAKLIFHNIN